MTASMLSNRRLEPPFGLNGGGAGALGRNAVVRADGGIEEYPACCGVAMGAEDVFIIETPGGGGFGASIPES
jgi:5-oxoprolinase (ATP-hydrolysing)